MKHVVIGGLALVLAAASMPMAAEAFPTTVNCPVDTIAAALTGGFDDITVNGTCTEGLITIVQDDVTIHGASGATIVGGFYVNGARRVRMESLTIESGAPPDGIFADNNSDLTVSSVVIRNMARYGALVDHGASVRLTSVTIENAHLDGVFAARNSYLAVELSTIQGAAEAGLNINSGAAADVLDSIIQNNGTNGIQLVSSAPATVARNTIVGNQGFGVALTGNAHALLENNTINNNSFDGVVVGNDSSGELSGNTIQANLASGVTIQGSSSAVLTGNSITGNSGNGVVADQGSNAALNGNTIDGNADKGVLVLSSSSAQLAGNAITNSSGNGVVVDTGSHAALDSSTIQNNGGGIDINRGSSGDVANSTIQNNGEFGIHVGYSSTAQILDNPIIQATAIPVSVDFGASALLSGNTVTATETDDGALDMDWGATVRLAGGNILQASPIGFSIFMQQGSTLIQRSQLDTVNGPVWVRSASNAEFRKVHITGNVQIEDHSLVRFRELTNDGNVAVTGNLSVSRDSGLNFVGGLPVRVKGNISCADQESSLGTDNLVLTGTKNGCTGYNNQNAQN